MLIRLIPHALILVPLYLCMVGLNFLICGNLGSSNQQKDPWQFSKEVRRMLRLCWSFASMPNVSPDGEVLKGLPKARRKPRKKMLRGGRNIFSKQIPEEGSIMYTKLGRMFNKTY